jgi:hypothetical protein
MGTKFWSGYHKGKGHVGDLGVDGRIIMKGKKEICHGDVNLIEVAREKVQWCTFVNIIMNFRVP